MTQEEKQLLLKDLCARFPYGVIVRVHDAKYGDFDSYIENISNSYVETHAIEELDYIPYVFYKLEDIKPYLRPMYTISSIEEQELEYRTDGDYVDYCCKHHLDFRGLIKKGLAIEAPEGMYN